MPDPVGPGRLWEVSSDPNATDGPPWFYNVRTGRVEGVSGARAADRLGPYATREEAQAALERVQQRNDEWDEGDQDGGREPDES